MEEKKLVGCYKKMSFLNNMTKELWQGFMPKRKTISSVIGTVSNKSLHDEKVNEIATKSVTIFL